MNAAFRLQGRTALVTGSSRGIGRAIALGLAANGARVIFHGAAPSSELGSAAAEAGQGAQSLSADLADRASVRSLCAQARAAAGHVDILVINASIEIREPWQATTDAAFDRQVAVNLDATRLLIEGLVPDMCERGWGRVLAIGSVQEVKEHPRMLVYAALKAAQSSMMRNLRRQLAPRGVTCNTLAPGVIETGRNEAVLADEAYRESCARPHPRASFRHARGLRRRRAAAVFGSGPLHHGRTPGRRRRDAPVSSTFAAERERSTSGSETWRQRWMRLAQEGHGATKAIHGCISTSGRRGRHSGEPAGCGESTLPGMAGPETIPGGRIDARLAKPLPSRGQRASQRCAIDRASTV